MVIEHSFMNKSYTAKIYIYMYIYIYDNDQIKAAGKDYVNVKQV